MCHEIFWYMKTRIELENKIKELKSILLQKYFVEKIGIFGSYVRDEQKESSDIDIVVSFSRPLGWEFFDLQFFLEQELGLNVDIITEKAIKEQIRKEILKSVKYL